MKALQVSRKVGRLGLARMVSAISPSAAAKIRPDRAGHHRPARIPRRGLAPGQDPGSAASVAAICQRSRVTPRTYFDDWVSSRSPLVTRSSPQMDDGQRIVMEPVLGHAARGFPLPFPDAAPADGDDYAHLALPPLEPGIQTGFCHSTGGGWGTEFLAHDSQIHRCPTRSATKPQSWSSQPPEVFTPR